MKKLISMVLALCMLISMTAVVSVVPASAEYISSDLSISGLFLNQNGENITSSNIASATKVTALNAVLKNHFGDAPFAILAAYKDAKLVKCVKMETKVILSGTSLTGELTFDAGSVDDVQLFVWESSETIRPLCSAYGLDRIIGQQTVAYTITIPFEEELMPTSISSEGFEILSAYSDEPLEIDSAIYKPMSKEVCISLSPVWLIAPVCDVTVKEGVKTLDGGSASGSFEFTAVQEYDCDMYGVSVDSVTMWQEGSSVTMIETGKPLTVKVGVVNTSGAAAENINVAIFIENKDGTIDEMQRTINLLPSDAGTEVVFEIEGGLSAENTGIIHAAVNG